MSTVNLSRRRFLRNTGIASGGLVVGFSLNGCSTPALPINTPEGAFTPNAFLQLGTDNSIRFYCPRDEMGQGVTTGLTTIISEELDINPQSVLVELASAHPDYTNPDFGAQATGGSTSVKAHYQQLRQVGADVRALLIKAAAQDLGINVDDIRTTDGHILARGKRYPYGQFVPTAASLEMSRDTPLKNPSEFQYIGKHFPRLDGVAKSTGTAIFGIDVDVPGMQHAVVKRSPVAGGRVKSFDAKAAKAMPGVHAVVEVVTGLAVVADKYWQAKQAAEKLKIEWDTPALAQASSAQIRTDYSQALREQDAESSSSNGDVGIALEASIQTINNQYWAPYLSHAPMEPMNAVVHVRDNEAEVWSGTQGPGVCQGLVARWAGLDPENVIVHQTYLGGAFGRRATLHHVIEATQASMATGKPVHLLWSREDDIRHGVYRPASLMNINAGVDSSGKINAWSATRVGGNITPETLKNVLPGALPGVSDGVIDWIVGMADSTLGGWVVDTSSVEGLDEDYDFPNFDVSHITHDHGVPLTFWRSVGHSYTAFAKETAIDELAELANKDVVTFRTDNLTNNPRMANVVAKAGALMKQMQPPEGHYLGFAAHTSFSSYVAQVAEVSIEGGQIKVHKVLCVVDCGVAINPDVIKAQMEGSVMYGLTAALYGNHEISNGEIQESNFHDYPILRMHEAPEVEVVIVASSEAPTGVGEPGLPPIAPAVANAVYRATSQRLRSLPLKLG